MHQKPDQIEETRWEGQNVSEVVVPQEEEEESKIVASYKCQLRHWYAVNNLSRVQNHEAFGNE